MIDVRDLRVTIAPKSDQLNSEQLLAGPITITVSDVRAGTDEQPVVVHYYGDAGQPYKPCKTMRKVLVLAWGEDGRTWVGKTMQVYNDPSVKFGGMEVGGIRIRSLTHIPQRIKVALTATRGKKSLHEIDPMADDTAQIVAAATVEECKTAFGTAYKTTHDPLRRAALKGSYDARISTLQAGGA